MLWSGIFLHSKINLFIHMYINKSTHPSVCFTISWNWWLSLTRSPDTRLIYESQLLSYKSAMNNWNLFSCFVFFLRFLKMWIILKVFIEFVTIFFWPQGMWDTGFPGGTVIKNPPARAGDSASTPGSGRCPGEGNSNPLQHSCLENPMDRGAWQATVHRDAKETLSD